MSATVGGVSELPDPPLRAPGLLLRPWRRTDLARLHEAFSDPETQRFSWSSLRPYTLADAEQYLLDVAQGRQDGREVQWALVDPADDDLLGCLALYQVDAEQGTASVGYWLAGHARGRGLATRALGLVTEWAFTTVGLHRLELTCAPENTASQRVAERAGFHREGVLRSHVPFKGARRDSVLFSRLPGDHAESAGSSAPHP